MSQLTSSRSTHRSISVLALSSNLDAYLADVATGDTIVITRDGRPVATLAPVNEAACGVQEEAAAYGATPTQPPTALLRLVGSAAARSVLGVFVMEPVRPIHQREVARRAGVALRSAQLALKRLESLGLIQSERDGNRRNYRANRTSRFEELRALLSPELGLAGVIARALAPFESRITRAFIFGSAASGEDKIGSDIDVLVVGTVASDELVEPIANAQRELGREIDLVTYAPWDFSSRIVAGNHFLRTTLAGPRVDLIGGSDDA